MGNQEDWNAVLVLDAVDKTIFQAYLEMWSAVFQCYETEGDDEVTEDTSKSNLQSQTKKKKFFSLDHGLWSIQFLSPAY